jgi:hypothetical protein
LAYISAGKSALVVKSGRRTAGGGAYTHTAARAAAAARAGSTTFAAVEHLWEHSLRQWLPSTPLKTYKSIARAELRTHTPTLVAHGRAPQALLIDVQPQSASPG